MALSMWIIKKPSQKGREEEEAEYLEKVQSIKINANLGKYDSSMNIYSNNSLNQNLQPANQFWIASSYGGFHVKIKTIKNTSLPWALFSRYLNCKCF